LYVLQHPSCSHDQTNFVVSRVFLGLGVALTMLTFIIFLSSIFVFLDGSPSFGMLTKQISNIE
jgi:hypothetical protein